MATPRQVAALPLRQAKDGSTAMMRAPTIATARSKKAALQRGKFFPPNRGPLGARLPLCNRTALNLRLSLRRASSTLIHPMRIEGGTGLRNDNYGHSDQRHRGG